MGLAGPAAGESRRAGASLSGESGAGRAPIQARPGGGGGRVGRDRMRAGRPRSQGKADAEGRGSRGIDFFMNIDAQDEQDESLLHEKPAPAMIACEFADAQDYKLAVS